MSTRVFLIGKGKMGSEIESILKKRNDCIISGLASRNFGDADSISALKNSDVAIEFSSPEAAAQNLKCCIQHGIPVVCGTTGWKDQLAEVEAFCRKQDGGMLWSPNFSLGVNILFHVNEQLAGWMNKLSDYQLEITETHHIHKKDAPSGTAIRLAEGIIQSAPRYQRWNLGESQNPDSIPVFAHRVEEVPGTHVITWKSAFDMIELRHEAFSRQGFAAGAVEAALWMVNRKGCFQMKDFLADALK